MTAPTLTEFLMARIAEDEEVVRDGEYAEVDLSFVEHFDPARMLAECEAKRRIVEACEDERQRMDIYNRDYPLGLLTTEGDLRARLSANARWAGLDVAVRALVLPYADHADFDEAWKP